MEPRLLYETLQDSVRLRSPERSKENSRDGDSPKASKGNSKQYERLAGAYGPNSADGGSEKGERLLDSVD